MGRRSPSGPMIGAVIGLTIIVLTIVSLIALIKLGVVDARTLGIDLSSIGLISNLAELAGVIAPIVLIVIIGFFAPIRQIGIKVIVTLLGRQLGINPLPSGELQNISKLLTAQMTRMAQITSWPEHAAVATASRTAAKVDFGDAALIRHRNFNDRSIFSRFHFGLVHRCEGYRVEPVAPFDGRGRSGSCMIAPRR